jgi:2-polyprenyl-3-methyl-5-hydroxy-6-metoxy-1,4-benzoquinol methylase
MSIIKDDRGYNQIFRETKTNLIRAQRRNNYFIKIINTHRTNEILEIGCGLGDLSYSLAANSKNNVLGTDLCVPFIEEAQTKYKLPNLEFIVLDFNHPKKLGNKKFDYIVGTGILHHLYYELDSVLVNIKNLLKEGGKIIFLEPNLLNPYCYLIFNTTDFFRNWAKLEPTEKAFSKTYIKKKLLKAGFKTIEIENKDFLVPGTPYSLIKLITTVGDIVERIPGLKLLSQSIFICAS